MYARFDRVTLWDSYSHVCYLCWGVEMSNQVIEKRAWLDQAALWMPRIDVNVAAFTRFWETVRLPEVRSRDKVPTKSSFTRLYIGTPDGGETGDEGVPLFGIPLHQIVAPGGAIIDASPVS